MTDPWGKKEPLLTLEDIVSLRRGVDPEDDGALRVSVVVDLPYVTFVELSWTYVNGFYNPVTTTRGRTCRTLELTHPVMISAVTSSDMLLERMRTLLTTLDAGGMLENDDDLPEVLAAGTFEPSPSKLKLVYDETTVRISDASASSGTEREVCANVGAWAPVLAAFRQSS